MENMRREEIIEEKKTCEAKLPEQNDVLWSALETNLFAYSFSFLETNYLKIIKGPISLMTSYQSIILTTLIKIE